MYLYNQSTNKVFKATPKMLRNISVKSYYNDVSYLKKITLKKAKELKLEIL